MSISKGKGRKEFLIGGLEDDRWREDNVEITTTIFYQLSGEGDNIHDHPVQILMEENLVFLFFH